jgi:4-hydroxy-tetrahydrodipicolinate reductase
MTLVREVTETAGCRLVAAIEQAGHGGIGADAGVLAGAGALDVVVGDDAGALFAAAEVVLEFSSAEASVAHAGLAAETGTAHVLGTTGLDSDQQAALAAAADRAAIVWAPNMSIGVNLVLALAERAAAVLDENYDIEIVEIHHRHKVDAPSGTALALGEAVAAGRGVALAAAGVRARDGITGARRVGDIGFAVLRGGDVVGEHTVVFAADGERVELAHKASSRRIFAAGAVRSALWARNKPPGLYGLRDVLGLNG